jgi:threonine dehydrogenase-like Zn-dependent dehydrogenase
VLSIPEATPHLFQVVTATETFYPAAVMPAPGAALRVEEIAAPVLERGSALLHVLFSEVCGTDVHLHHGRLSGVPYPIIPGHVSVGVIAELPAPIEDVDGVPFREGDVVTFLDVHGTCGRCYECLVTKQTTRCKHRRVYGITYGARDGLLGGWAGAIWMRPGVHMMHLPAGLAPETFIGGGCGLVTAFHAVERAELGLGQSVAVLGAGPVGQSAIALAAVGGAGRVIAIGDPASRLDFARRMGATDTIGLDVPPNDRAARVRELTGGRGVDVVIEAAGAPEAVSQALDLVRDGGRVVVCGQYTDTGDVRIHPHWQINRKHLEIRGCWGSDFSHLYRAVHLAARFGDRVPWRDMIGARYGLNEAGRALEAVEKREVTKAVIVP